MRRFSRKSLPVVTAVAPDTRVRAEGSRSVAIGGDSNGPVVSGDHATIVHLPSSELRTAAQVNAPAGVGRVRSRTAVFVGRDGELARLDEALFGPGGVIVQAVAGLGGIGKSTLAAQWASTRPHGFAPVWWINAESRAEVVQGLADLAVALQQTLHALLAVDALAEWTLQWLATHSGWLLILDNVTDPADIAAVVDRSSNGRVLVTSRLAHGWHHAAAVIRLDVLEPVEARNLLAHITDPTSVRDLDGADELCAVLGYLPLAVEQAGAYLAQNPLITPREYLKLLALDPAGMYATGGATSDAERTVARVWRVTFERIGTRKPLASQVLRILAWYAQDVIPAALLNEVADPVSVSDAIGLLSAYSMITLDPDSKTLSVHRLVQAVARTPDPEDPHRAPHSIALARESAIHALREASPAEWRDPKSWPIWRALLVHIDALTECAAEATDTLAAADLLNQAALFLDDQGSSTRAAAYLRRAVAGYERILGSEHPDTLTSRNNLANAYQSAGELARAIPLHERTLAERERILGPEHPDTLTSRNNLAYAYQSAGELTRAISLHERTLAERERILGPEHPVTRAIRNNLALANSYHGNPD